MNDPHIWYIVAAYAAGALILTAMSVRIFWDYFSLRRDLAALEGSDRSGTGDNR